MITILIIFGFLFILFLGLYEIKNKIKDIDIKREFAVEYRIKFIDFVCKYKNNYDHFTNIGNLDNELYIWLTMNANKMQNYLGSYGLLDYKPQFQNYYFQNFQIITNTIPKFRTHNIDEFDINTSDDCLLRYIGYLEEYRNITLKNIKNPIIWFREGLKIIFNIPFFILLSLDIFDRNKVNKIKDSIIYKFTISIFTLTTFISGCVTIIVGYDESIEFIKKLFGI
jgi:hypothetical protein